MDMDTTTRTIDPATERDYWRTNHSSRPYAAGSSYEDYAPAYDYGVSSYSRHQGRDWDDVEDDLGRGWDRAKGSSSLTWEKAKSAVRDAWDRLTGDR
jgi:hypothetical protein